MIENTLKIVEFNRFKKHLMCSFSISWESFFQTNHSGNKVRYLWVSLGFIQWQLAFRIPTKMYGLRVVK